MYKKLLLVIAFLIVSPSFVSAEVGYEIESVKVMAELSDDNKVSVKEVITLSADGKIEKLARKIPRKIELLDVYGKLNPKNVKLSISGLPELDYKVSNRTNYSEVNLKESLSFSKNVELTVDYEVKVIDSEEGKYVAYLLKGSGGEVDIGWVEYTLVSENTNISDVRCFAGDIANLQRQCTSEFDPGKAVIKSATRLEGDKDFMVLVKIEEPESENKLTSGIGGQVFGKGVVVIVGLLTATIIGFATYKYRKKWMRMIPKLGKRKSDKME